MSTETYILRRSQSQWARALITRLEALLASKQISRTIGIQTCESLETLERRLIAEEKTLTQQDLAVIRSTLAGYDVNIKAFENAAKA